jgi:hypothetical protein
MKATDSSESGNHLPLQWAVIIIVTAVRTSDLTNIRRIITTIPEWFTVQYTNLVFRMFWIISCYYFSYKIITGLKHKL